jgi:hypothetical protein
MLWEKFTHPYETQIGEIGLSIGILIGEPGKLRKVFSTIERDRHQTFIDHRKNHSRVFQMKCRFRKDSLARQQRLRDAAGNLSRPVVIFVIGVRKRHQEARIGDALHGRENPFRPERSRAPRTLPASLMKDGAAPPSRAFSSCSRMMRPRGTPERLAT